MLQLEQKFLQANLAQARTLLAEATLDDDPIGAHQFGHLVADLQGKLQGMPDAMAQAPAGVALFVGGRPVVGSHGIQADFSGKVIDQFQTLVSQRFLALELGPLASKGRVPLKDNTHLLVTDVVRGSFGFVLQAAEPDDAGQPASTTLKAVVDKVAETLSRVAAQDDMLFDGAVAEIDDRQQRALTDFFKLLDTEGATVRIVEGERDFELDHAAVQRARHRVENLRISEDTVVLNGQIIGWTDYSARFELRLHGNQELVQGAITREALDRVSVEGVEPYHKHVRATVKLKRVTMGNRQPRSASMLLGLEMIDPPPDWVWPPVHGAID
jgi:hypothetical protein